MPLPLAEAATVLVNRSTVLFTAEEGVTFRMAICPVERLVAFIPVTMHLYRPGDDAQDRVLPAELRAELADAEMAVTSAVE
jgi:hypothetical protein